MAQDYFSQFKVVKPATPPPPKQDDYFSQFKVVNPPPIVEEPFLIEEEEPEIVIGPRTPENTPIPSVKEKSLSDSGWDFAKSVLATAYGEEGSALPAARGITRPLLPEIPEDRGTKFDRF